AERLRPLQGRARPARVLQREVGPRRQGRAQDRGQLVSLHAREVSPLHGPHGAPLRAEPAPAGALRARRPAPRALHEAGGEGRPPVSTPASAVQPAWDYEALAALVRGERLPLVVVDLDLFEANVRRLVGIAAAHGKRLRPASKSVRVPELLRLIASIGAPTVRGVMCYSVDEASLLASEGLDDFLVAYPTVQESDVEIAWRLTQAGTTLALMLDAPEHAAALARAWQAHGEGRPLRVCIDVDMSWRPLGQHVGVQRSPVRTLSEFARV